MTIKMSNQMLAFLLVAVIIVATGCASIVSRSNYPISINSNPSGANITVLDKRGMNVYNGTTPANFMLRAGDGFFSKAHYTVNFEMDGYEARTVPVYFSMDGWYIGNLFFGGFIGFLIVDPATGAMWRLDTPFIDENLQKSDISNKEAELKIYTYNDIPENWKKNLVQINKW